MEIQFEVLDHKTLTPLTNTWKKAVSVAVEAAFMGSGRIVTLANKQGLDTSTLLDISDYHTDKTLVFSDAEWQAAATALDKLLVV